MKYTEHTRRLPLKLIAFAVIVAASFNGPAADFTINVHRFTVPDGFEVTLAAGTNLVPRPVSASFDDMGWLYVTDSSGIERCTAEATG